MQFGLNRAARFALLAGLVAVFSNSAVANAAFINSFSSTFSVKANGANSVKFAPSALAASDPALPDDLDINDITVNLAASFGVAMTPNLTFTSNSGADAAVFSFLGPLTLSNVTTTTGKISGYLKLVSDDSSIDFQNFYEVVFTYTGMNIIGDGTYTLTNTAGGSFDAINGTDDVPPHLPEPASLTVFALLGLTGYAARRQIGLQAKA